VIYARPLAGSAGDKTDTRRRKENGGDLMPPPLLDTGHRDHQFAVGSSHDRQVQDPVLFRADEFLPVDQQDRAIFPVDEE
jgi:hypothetical protein